MIPYIKSIFQEIPRPIGQLISHVPYRLRPGIGKSYALHKRNLNQFEELGIDEKKAFIVARMRKVVDCAASVPFYRDLYKKHGIDSKELNSFSDILNLPIVTKEMLSAAELEKRSGAVKGRYITNTGGSSGSPLAFYITPTLIPNEWAHMHRIWSKYGYDQSKLKLYFGGRNIGDKAIAYDGLRHQYAINIYKGIQDIIPRLRGILKYEKVEYLHGYPSALAEFSYDLKKHAPDLVIQLRQTLRGAFLGSEYPASVYRDRIESIFGIPTVSWYGHTERSILAWEKNEKFVYYPFQTYGYCEAVKNPETGGYRLIGTSYGNFASPFIRYDTGDDIEPVVVQDGLLISFRIRTGRLGEFVVDRHGTKISLTALIFGRHHRLFDVAQFIQVRQKIEGEMTVLITPKGKLPCDFVFEQWFDVTGLDLDIDYEVLERPILTKAGKVVLKVN